MCCSCQIVLADGSVEAGALMSVAYHCQAARRNGEAELAGLQAALGQPHLVQGLAAFKYGGPDDCHFLAIVTK